MPRFSVLSTIGGSLAFGFPNVPVVDVFTRGENGYYCIKIPSLTALQDGSLLALGEGRRESCSDGAWTDLIMKRSKDGGLTWSNLTVIHEGDSRPTTIGNAAPVMLADGTLVLVYNANNTFVYSRRSSDMGQTWSDYKDISASVTLPEWGFMGTGPPAGLRLGSGRLLIPSYHHNGSDHYHFKPNSHGHALISDDDGHTWRMSTDHDFGTEWHNENQYVDLGGGRVASFARGMGNRRTRVESQDGGEHWGAPEVLETLPDMLTGCEGSVASCPADQGTGLVFAGVQHDGILRKNMTIFFSSDEGHTWEAIQQVDPGASAYTALAFHGGKLALLYERSNKSKLVFEPDIISFALLESPCPDPSGLLTV